MSIDYLVASLPALTFGQPPPIDWEAFCACCASAGVDADACDSRWADLDAQLRNASAECRLAARGEAGAGRGTRFSRPTRGCSLYWRKRVADCFAETDVAKRDELLDRVRWDAADELTDVSNPLGRGALGTYAVRLRIALRRALISRERGNAAFDRLTAGTRLTF